ncbi:DUF2142 domain-containing protein [Microbacterium sp. NE2HP2]|uniref:DUF2142 domain-containing protein n=1 Tax=Microbacterium plantarum TaxID=1816425 RepID=UPI002366B2C0|nr:DUF2142 domain-containing protein [Microbacterium plantarum]MDD7945110.1 DUF2142 domain-containing protein [Microbacterium plantarum]
MQLAILGAAFFAVLSAGVLFFPVGSGPDEAAHYVYASAVVRGQAAMLEPTLPARIANIHSFATCIAFQPDITAACQGPLRMADGLAEVKTQTNAGLYNPVFYAWTGLGSLLVPTEYGLYVSRLLSAAVTAILLAWAVSLLLRTTTTTWARAGLALVLTPMTLYCGMVLNPSAWEIASMMGVVVATHAILRGSLSRTWTEAHSLLLVAGMLLIVSRGLSPLLLALTMGALLLTRRLKELRWLLTDRSVWTVAGVFAAVGAFSVGWVIAVGTNYVGVTRPASLREGLTGISVFYANFHDQLTQIYGSLGWLDLASPNVLSSAWLFLIGFFVVVSFAVSRANARRGVLLAFAAAVLLPGALAGLQWSGMGWQGRYTLPLVAACVLIAGLSYDEAVEGSRADVVLRLSGVGRILLPAFFVVGVCATAVQVAHRYSVGVSQPWLAPPSWAPPIDALLLGVMLTVGTATIAAALVSTPGTRARSVARAT